jgi:hypothetical protein
VIPVGSSPFFLKGGRGGLFQAARQLALRHYFIDLNLVIKDPAKSKRQLYPLTYRHNMEGAED